MASRTTESKQITKSQSLNGFDESDSIEKVIRTILADPEFKPSRTKLEKVFEKIDSHTLILSLEGKHEELLLFTSMHVSLLIKCAPKFEDRLLNLAHVMNLHLANVPKSFCVLTVKNNLITAFIHFHQWKRAYDQATLLCGEIDTEIKNNPKLNENIQQVLDKKLANFDEVSLEEQEKRILVLLLSTYLNLILGGRAVFKGNIDELSKLIPIIQKGYKLSSRLLKNDDFSKKFKHVLKSLMSPDYQTTTANQGESTLVKPSESPPIKTDEKEKEEIVQEICGENVKESLIRKKSSDSSMKFTSLKNYMVSKQSSFKTSKMNLKHFKDVNPRTNSPATNSEKVTSSQSKFFIASKHYSNKKEIAIKLNKPQSSHNSFKISFSKRNKSNKAALDQSQEATSQTRQPVPEVDPMNEETMNKEQSKHWPNPDGEISPPNKVSKVLPTSLVIKKRVSSQIRSLTDTSPNTKEKTPDYVNNLKEGRIRAPSICLKDALKFHNQNQSVEDIEAFGDDHESHSASQEKKKDRRKRSSQLYRSKATLRSIVNMDDKSQKKIECESRIYKRNTSLNSKEEKPQGASIMITPSPLQSPDKVDDQSTSDHAQHQAQRRDPQRDQSEEPMSITLKKNPKLELKPVASLPGLPDESPPNQNKESPHNQTLKQFNERPSRKKLTGLQIYPQTQDHVHPNLVKSFNNKQSPKNGKDERVMNPGLMTTERGMTEIHTVSSQANFRLHEMRRREEPDISYAIQGGIMPHLSMGYFKDWPSAAYVAVPNHAMRQTGGGSPENHTITPPSNQQRLNQSGDIVQEYMSIKSKADHDQYVASRENQISSLNEIIGDRTKLLNMVQSLLSENRDLQVKLKIKSGVNSVADSGDFSHQSGHPSDPQEETRSKVSKPVRATQDTLGFKTINGNMDHTSKSSNQIERKPTPTLNVAPSPSHLSPPSNNKLAVPRLSGFSMRVDQLSAASISNRGESLTSFGQNLAVIQSQTPNYQYRAHRSSTNIPSNVVQRLGDNKDKIKTNIYDSSIKEEESASPQKDGFGFHSFNPKWDQLRQNFIGESIKVIKSYLLEGCPDLLCSYIKVKMNQDSKELNFEVATYLVAGGQGMTTSSIGIKNFNTEEPKTYTEEKLAQILENLDMNFIDIYPNCIVANQFVEYMLRFILIRYTRTVIDNERRSIRTEITSWPQIADSVLEVSYMNAQYNAHLVHNEGKKFWLSFVSNTSQRVARVKLRVEVWFDKPTFEESYRLTSASDHQINDNSFRLKFLDSSNIQPEDRAAVV